MKRMISPLLPLLLAGCFLTETVAKWDKAGADDDAVARDKAECRLVAEREAVRRYGAPPAPSSAAVYGQSSAVVGTPSSDPERFNVETRLQAACMKSRGYNLVKVSAPKEAPPPEPEKPEK